MNGFKPLGLDHVVLRVRDQAASTRFYRNRWKAFGMICPMPCR